MGQNFWYLISENKELYTEIIEPLGHRAREHNERFIAGRGALVNRFTVEFLQRFCNPSGALTGSSLSSSTAKISTLILSCNFTAHVGALISSLLFVTPPHHPL